MNLIQQLQGGAQPLVSCISSRLLGGTAAARNTFEGLILYNCVLTVLFRVFGQDSLRSEANLVDQNKYFLKMK